ncbi:MAG: polysaccharide deacetylase [Solirubrobacterales bacterium]
MVAGAEIDWGWPGGASVAVSLTFDVDAESGWLGEGEEYRRRITTLSEGAFGVRRGVPRILELLDGHGIPASFFVPGDTAERHAGLVPELLERGHEIGHHGYLHLRSDKVCPGFQREEIERGLEALAAAGAPVPRGYRSTSWELTPETFALLHEFDFTYDSSCMGDDRPYLQEWEGETLLELPVHWSLDDWPRFGWNIDGGGNVGGTGELLASWRAEFEAARAEGRHVTFTMHPEVIGRAYRFAALEELVAEMVAAGDVWFARLGEVADHVGPRLRAQASAD